MPRTKRPKVIPKQELQSSSSNSRAMKELMKECKEEALKMLNDAYNDIIRKYEEFIIHAISSVPPKYRDMTIEELGNLASFNSTVKSVQQSARRTRHRSLSCDDDGYNTADSGSLTDNKTVRGRNKNKRQSNRTSRSLSRNNQSNALVPRSKQIKETPRSYKTPVNQRTNNASGLITPKCNLNTPQMIMRRPQQGEVAVSLQGSPLLTHAFVEQPIANVNIPLADGKVLNLQPLDETLRMSMIPPLETGTLEQLETLRKNIEKMCQAGRQKKN